LESPFDIAKYSYTFTFLGTRWNDLIEGTVGIVKYGFDEVLERVFF